MSIDDCVESIAEKEAFIGMKDHKPNFMNRPTCRLISPSKSELGHVSKVILNRAVNYVVKATRVKLWKSKREVLSWYQNYREKDQTSFINFDIVEFYPSITEELLIKAIEFAKQFTEIQDNEKDLIIHTKRTVVFSNGEPWEKKDANSGFDVTMGSFDGAETCELVVCYILAQLQPKYGNAIGLYCDNGLGIFKETPRKIDCIKKDICKIFRQNNLRITVEANKKAVNFLDITLDLNTGQ